LTFPSEELPTEPYSPKKDRKKNRASDKPEKAKNKGGSHSKLDNTRNRFEDPSANDGHIEATPDWSGHVRNDDIWTMPSEKEKSEPTPDYVTKWLDENIKGIRTEPTGKPKDLPSSNQTERDTSSESATC